MNQTEIKASRRQLRKALGPDTVALIESLIASNEALSANLGTCRNNLEVLKDRLDTIAVNQINLNERLEVLEKQAMPQ